jgi:hypothetical protein
MNWNKASAFAEIVSSVAILATLVYLAIQTQQVATQTEQNTVAIEAQARASLIEMGMAVLDHGIQNPSIYISQFQSEPLTQEQKVALSFWLFEFVGQREFMWLQNQSGIIDARTLETLISDVDQVLANPRTLSWWNLTSDFYFDPEFVQAVNARAGEGLIDSVPDWISQWE